MCGGISLSSKLEYSKVYYLVNRQRRGQSMCFYHHFLNKEIQNNIRSDHGIIIADDCELEDI